MLSRRIIGAQAGNDKGQYNPNSNNSNKLPRINSNSAMDSQKQMLPPISSQGGMKGTEPKKQILQLQQNEKESQKIREISRAYKISMENLDDLKERYRSLKKMEKKNKNTSMPHKNLEIHAYNNGLVL